MYKDQLNFLYGCPQNNSVDIRLENPADVRSGNLADIMNKDFHDNFNPSFTEQFSRNFTEKIDWTPTGGPGINYPTIGVNNLIENLGITTKCFSITK